MRGQFYLAVSCEVATPEPMAVDEYLGVDLGIVNIATDSDGQQYSGSQLLGIRERRFRQRRRLQAKGSKRARRLLRRLSGREGRMVRQENHRIAKEIVTRAQRTGRGIALEELRGIRDRVRVRRAQRRQVHGWSFHDLRGRSCTRRPCRGCRCGWCTRLTVRRRVLSVVIVKSRIVLRKVNFAVGLVVTLTMPIVTQPG